MRPAAFDPSVLRQHLRRNKIADLPELKRVLGTDTALTVFRKLRQLGYLASYTHRGRFYTLSNIAHFDDRGLWSHQAVGSSGMAPCCPPWRPSFNGLPTPTNVRTPKCRSLYATWCSGNVSAGPKSMSSYSIQVAQSPQPIVAQRSHEAVPLAVHSPTSKSPPMNSKPQLSSSMACSTNSSAACLPAWNPSGSATVVTPFSA